MKKRIGLTILAFALVVALAACAEKKVVEDNRELESLVLSEDSVEALAQ